MTNGKFISFHRVLYRAMRHPNASDLTEEQAAEYAYELIRLLGIPLSFNEKTQYSVIKDNRVKLPDDIIYLRGIRYSVDKGDTNQVNWLPVKYTGNIYQSSFHCPDYLDNNCPDDITYTINNNYAFLSESDGAIEIAYRGLVLDEDGYPMIPDNQPFEDALYYYILKEYFFPLLGMSKITQYYYNKIEQEYAWAAGKVQSFMVLSGMDHWESTMNGIRRLIQPQNLADDGYQRLHKQERLKKRF
ncbi:Tail tubular protein (P22 gp4-like) [Cellulophaga phage phi14:2]|uniref:Structural protein n=1 Tax=Cellulophaga phage phi14:2 TaxID=1327990 RepID=S0A0R5_9CAUD|nr:Tail tubular protein (P22 gp4-like) [Cellulophaga phage phi14:2]AGO48961.1 structural protein [Cellulophaga phage phi14:2]